MPGNNINSKKMQTKLIKIKAGLEEWISDPNERDLYLSIDHCLRLLQKFDSNKKKIQELQVLINKYK